KEKFAACETKATTRPLPESAGTELVSLPAAFDASTDARVTTPVSMSLTYTCCLPLFGVGTRFVAFDVNATYLPSSEISCAPEELTDSRVVRGCVGASNAPATPVTASVLARTAMVIERLRVVFMAAN